MNCTKIVLGTVILATTVLAGCSSHHKSSEKMPSEIQTLNVKIDQLSSDVHAIRTEVQASRDDAARANQRLDNQTHSYKK